MDKLNTDFVTGPLIASNNIDVRVGEKTSATGISLSIDNGERIGPPFLKCQPNSLYVCSRPG